MGEEAGGAGAQSLWQALWKSGACHGMARMAPVHGEVPFVSVLSTSARLCQHLHHLGNRYAKLQSERKQPSEM